MDKSLGFVGKERDIFVVVERERDVRLFFRSSCSSATARPIKTLRALLLYLLLYSVSLSLFLSLKLSLSLRLMLSFSTLNAINLNFIIDFLISPPALLENALVHVVERFHRHPAFEQPRL